jgi:bis(5'-nucleosidyl)-tetraphosphatase
MIESAGMAIVDLTPDGDKDNEPTVLCVRAYANWDFPKGQLEPGETHVTAAIRETEEETSLVYGSDYTSTGTSAGSTTYGSGTKKKTATYYVAIRLSDKDPFLPYSEELGKPENDEWRWIRLSHLKDWLPPRLHSISAELVNQARTQRQGLDEPSSPFDGAESSR